MAWGLKMLPSVVKRTTLACTVLLLPCAVFGADESPDIRIEAPAFALRGVPVSAVTVEVRDVDEESEAGRFDHVQINGVGVVPVRIDDEIAAEGPLWDAGTLQLQTSPSTGRKVFVTEDVIRVTLPDGRTASHEVRRLPGWCSLLPPLVAIGIAVILRETLVALFAAVWTGMALFTADEGNWPWHVAESFVVTVDTAVVGQLVPPDGDPAHVQIILFTLFLGCLVGVMSASHGTAALVDRLTPFTRSRRTGQVGTWLMGLVIFFDDYANTLLLGSTMRPVADRLRISREKLAFLVDATAAPIAGLALVSTWVGFEVGLIGDSLSRLADANSAMNYSGEAYGTFLATLPYRFYPLLLLAFVLLVAWTGRDFGPMRRAEQRAVASDRLFSDSAKPQASMGAEGDSVDILPSTAPGTMWNAVVPLGVLLAAMVIGFWISGRTVADSASPSLRQIISNVDSNRVLLVSSFLASVTAVLTAVATRSLSLSGALAAWLDGARSMLLGAAILVLAWAVAMVCDADHLNTAGYLVEVTTGRLDLVWMPALAFLLSAAVSFATGSSWATMGLLIPLIISVTFGLMTNDPALLTDSPIDRQPLMLASIGGILAGSIFGDHCSPISDTTVLSSVASDCDHIDHVLTQSPYAVCVGLVSLLIGCVPVGLGASPWFSLPLAMAALLGLIWMIGRPVEA